MSGVVFHDGMDEPAGRHRVIDLIEEGDELLVAMARRTAPENRALQRVQRSEQRGRAVADIVVSEGGALARLERQSGLRAIECLNLALLVDGQHHGMARRRHIEPHHVIEFGGKARVGRALEGPYTMGLQAVSVPDPLHGPELDFGQLGSLMGVG